MGYSPRGLKEADMTERLHFHELLGSGFSPGVEFLTSQGFSLLVYKIEVNNSTCPLGVL